MSTISGAMQQDPLYPHLAELIAACPLQAGPLYTTFKDLSLSIEWKDLRVLELPGTGWCAIVGHKRQEDALKAVVPLPLHTTSLKPSSLKSIFSSLAGMTISDLPASIPPLAPDVTTLRNQILAQKGQDTDTIEEEREEEEEGKAEKEITKQELDKEMIYMGIVTSDSTVVYYKLTKGIKKPADISDE